MVVAMMVCAPVMATAISVVPVQAADDGARFVPVAPERILDTRPGSGPVDGIEGVVPGGGTVEVQVTGRAGVPASGVSAVVLNVTMTEATAAGYVQVLPTGSGVIGASSNLNVERAGQTIANQVTVPVGAGGRVTIFTQSGGHLLADVSGYYSPTPMATAGRYSPLAAPSPRRVVDTRDLFSVPTVNPGDTKNCGDFANWEEARRWFWTYFYRWGDPAGLDGNGDLIPCESFPGPKTPQPPGIVTDWFKLTAGGTLRIPIFTGTNLPGGIGPSGSIAAVVANVTAVDATAPGYWQVLPTGDAVLGSSSNLNVERARQNISNQVIVPVGSDGTITVFSQSGGHVIVDIAGVFTGPTSPSSAVGLFVPVTPNRLLDTRDPANTAQPGPIPPTTSINVTAAGRFGVPAGAGAVALNATITEATNPGFVQVYPTGLATPGASSNLNAEAVGQTLPNAAYSGLDSSGRFSIFTQTGGHLLADVAGYFTGPTATAGSFAATEVLNSIPVAAENQLVDYDRTFFPHWTTGPGGCDTRAQVLIRDSLTPAQVDPFGCAVVAGDWLSSYDGITWTSPADVDIDHVVALKEAWESGAYLWTTARRTAFANDLTDNRTLAVVTDTVNTGKSDLDPAQWLTPNSADRCRYIGAWLSIKARWNLSIDTAEYTTINSYLNGPCTGLTITAWSPTP